MGKKFYETPEFKELSKEWEDILKRSGFIDSEKEIGTKRGFQQSAGGVFRNVRDPVRREAKELYFQQLTKCLHSACFDSGVDRVVMVLRSEGARITEICEALANVDMGRCRGVVRFIIRKYEHRWGIRNWTQNQLNYQWRKKLPTR